MTQTGPAGGHIYLMGRRHSGTTFLDVLIGNSAGVESLGEVVTGLHGGAGEPTAAGETIASSGYWQQARRLHRERTGRELLEDGDWLYWKSDIRNFLKAYFSRAGAGDWGKYAEWNGALLESLSQAAGGKRILDSNKEYTRALMFLKTSPGTKVLHLIRRPSAIVGSHYYRNHDKRNPVGFLKMHIDPGPFLFPLLMVTVGLSWTVGMIAAVLIKARYRKRVLDVSYEALMQSPETELERIGAWLGEDLSGVIQGVKSGYAFPVGHNIGGNELRHDGTFTFVPNVKGRRKVPLAYRVGATLFAAPGLLLRALFVRTA